jgi:S-formylglutathione hydrolase FrmB
MSTKAGDRRKGLIGVLVGIGMLCALGGFAPAHAASDEVTPAEDNPPGCVTAKGESDVQCGAQGRDHFANASHQPPITACADATNASGSKITRILPNGPRRTDGSLAFISGACVYLPPGYATSGLRYPVVYLLHGGGGDEEDWHVSGNVSSILDDAAAADPSKAVIAVMPDGRSGFWFDQADGSYRNEEYVLRHLVPYVDRHLRTIADRRGRSIIGLSNGGYGALHLAAKAPDLFVAAGAMSANLGARSMTGISDTSPQELGAAYYGNTPTPLASNLDPVDITIDVGRYCTTQGASCALVGVDFAFGPDNEAFVQALKDTGYTGTYEYRPGDGAHTWVSWTGWLRNNHLPFALARMADPSPTSAPLVPSPLPAAFRYRSIAPAFSVFGYDVSAERDVREFLDLRGVSADGFEVQGSGRAVVTTAGRYVPGAAYVVDGAGGPVQTLTADAAGRLVVPVDLGPSHQFEQYSPDARVAEAQGGYWTVRTVTITPDLAAVVPEGRTVGFVLLPVLLLVAVGLRRRSKQR